MSVSKRFLSLATQQLSQFADRPDVTTLVVYVAEPAAEGPPDLVPIGHWPPSAGNLPPLTADTGLHRPEDRRRWLPLRHAGVLLGALQVETATLPWPEPLRQRLHAASLCLTEGLCLDLEHRRLQLRLEQQQQQLEVLLHQLRNPLAALRTFAQLLLRRLEHDPRNRSLVEGLLQEERQLQRYVDAISTLDAGEAVLPPQPEATPLLLPPSLNGDRLQPLAPLLEPLLQRAAATAALQGRPWHAPERLPGWRGDSGAVAEILANLLENAFRYSPTGAPVGLEVRERAGGGWILAVWDGGAPIPDDERERIFEPGQRGCRGAERPGSGLGLALARQLAATLGGDLNLVSGSPPQGNSFRLSLPPEPEAGR
jgi:signal transduction histidine kinase